MLTRKVLAKGQVVIPKTIRDLLGINEGDDVIIDIDCEKIILSKKQEVYGVFLEVSQRNAKRISISDIKKELKARYKEA